MSIATKAVLEPEYYWLMYDDGTYLVGEYVTSLLFQTSRGLVNIAIEPIEVRGRLLPPKKKGEGK